MQILVNNPTGFARTQVVVFGCPEGATSQGQLLVKRDDYEVRTARIKVEAYASGYQELVSLPAKEPVPVAFTGKHIDGGGTFHYELEEVLASNDMMTVSVWMAKGSNTVARIVLYQGAGEPWVRYQFLGCVESLASMQTDVFMDLFPSFGGSGVLQFDRILGLNPIGIFQGTMDDTSGVQTQGVFIDHNQINMDDPEEVNTASAEAHGDLDVAGDYRLKWGPWNTIPKGSHPDRKADSAMLAHRGHILEKNASRTGDQAGFGRWKNLDTISQGLGDKLAHDKWAVGQEACRRIWFFEQDGSFPKPESHPYFVSWSETRHYSRGVSPDQFRRLYTAYFEGGWGGMDDEHYSCVALKEAFMLRGDFLALIVMRMKAFHLKMMNRWPGAGRALGRLGMGAIDCYRGTEDPDLLAKISGDLLSSVKRNYTDVNNGLVLGEPRPVRALRLIKDDPHTGIKGLEWVVWEDAQAIGAMDILWQLTNDPDLKMMTLDLGRSIVWNGVGADGRILKAIKWNGPENAPGPGSASSTQTNYHEWAYDAWAVTARLAAEIADTETIDRAAELGMIVRNGNYYNKDSYLAPAP